MDALIELITGNGLIAGIIGAVVGAFVVYLKGRQSGRNQERVKNMKRQNRALKVKSDALQMAGRADIDDIRERLRRRANR